MPNSNKMNNDLLFGRRGIITSLFKLSNALLKDLDRVSKPTNAKIIKRKAVNTITPLIQIGNLKSYENLLDNDPYNISIRRKIMSYHYKAKDYKSERETLFKLLYCYVYKYAKGDNELETQNRYTEIKRHVEKGTIEASISVPYISHELLMKMYDVRIRLLNISIREA